MNNAVKNVLATLTVGLAVLIAAGAFLAYDWPVLASWRIAAVVVFALGLGTCMIYGSNVTPAKDRWSEIAASVGMAAGIFSVWTVITDSKVGFTLLTSCIIFLWIQTSVHQLWRSDVRQREGKRRQHDKTTIQINSR